MRIVHISCVAPPETGGIGRVAFIESELLRERGHDSVVIAPLRRGAAATAGVERLRSSFSLGHGAFLDRDELTKRCADADIVHLHYPFYGTDALVAWLKATGVIKKLVITVHMDASAKGLKGLFFSVYRALLQNWILGQADAVCVSSIDYARHSSYKTLVGGPQAPLLVELPFGVDTDRFHPAERSAAEKTVLFVGGMDTPHAFKGVEVLVKAIACMPKDVYCILAGDGDLRDGFIRLAERLGVKDRMDFIGRVPDADLPGTYRRAKVLAFPSTSVAEAFGLVALEAQASGVPVVASDLPGVRTVVKAGETGLLVPVRDVEALAGGLMKVLSDDALRTRLAVNARARVLAEYTWKMHMDRLIAIYKKICASPS